MEKRITIHKDISIEDLTQEFPGSVSYLLARGIHCVVCGEPLWGTLASVARDKGFSESEIDAIIDDLTKLQEVHKDR